MDGSMKPRRSIEDVAKLIGTSSSTVQRAEYSALRKLQRAIEEDLGPVLADIVAKEAAERAAEPERRRVPGPRAMRPSAMA